MASASSTVRDPFTLPIEFEVRPIDSSDKSPSYQVTLSNKTWETERFNPQATFATVKNLTHTPALQPITVTVAHIFSQDWTNPIKYTRTSFTLVTGQIQLSTMKEAIDGTRSISVEEGHPTQLVLSTVNLKTKTHLTNTQFISRSTYVTTALSAGAEASTTALTQAAAPSTNDDASSAKHEATASSSALASVDMSQPSSTGPTSTSLAPIEEVEEESDDENNQKFGKQLSVDSTGNEITYHTPTQSPNPASGQATFFTDMPPPPASLLHDPTELNHNNGLESNRQQSFTPPPPPPNPDQSSYLNSMVGTPNKKADDGDVFEFPPPPVDETDKS